jgi:hypothetical protein
MLLEKYCTFGVGFRILGVRFRDLGTPKIYFSEDVRGI